MKSIKTFAAVIALSVLPFASFAQSVTAIDSTLDGAEAVPLRRLRKLVLHIKSLKLTLTTAFT